MDTNFVARLFAVAFILTLFNLFLLGGTILYGVNFLIATLVVLTLVVMVILAKGR